YGSRLPSCATVMGVVSADFKGADVRNVVAALIAVGLAAVTVVAQGPQSGAPASNTASSYKAPRTTDGHPDLQGVWANNSVTPMTRPTQWKDKESITDAEVKELQMLLSKY